MRTVYYIIRKEFTQLFRNKTMLRIIIFMPLVQLFILAYAATFEIRNIHLHVTDHDRSAESRELIGHFQGSPFYTVIFGEGSYRLAEEQIIRDEVDQAIIIPTGFSRDLQKENKAAVQLVTNAINGSAASLMDAYSKGIIRSYNQSLRVDNAGRGGGSFLEITFSYWYNPQMDYISFMVPGILVLLVTIIGMLLSGMNLVKEKEVGTIEQINVTPIRKYQFLSGKLIPFWALALAELAVGLILAKLAFDIPIVGSPALIFFVAAIYLLVVQGIGLLISTVTNTQQQSMFLTWFFMVIFILMSGLFTPVESMPAWAQILNWINPLAYFIESIRMIMLKGSVIGDIWENLVILSVYGFIILRLAIWRYKKVA